MRPRRPSPCPQTSSAPRNRSRDARCRGNHEPPQTQTRGQERRARCAQARALAPPVHVADRRRFRGGRNRPGAERGGGDVGGHQVGGALGADAGHGQGARRDREAEEVDRRSAQGDPQLPAPRREPDGVRVPSAPPGEEMIGEDVLYQSVAELGPQIRARKLSPVELTDAYLARIEKHNASLNAFARVTADLARGQAQAAEKEINAGRYRGPLHGIPYGAKDLLATAGIPTEWGATPCKGQVFDKDATVVRKLREAGAILLGKCAMVEFAGCLGYRAANASISGPGRNPWDRTRWTGGSSSGSGAAVAGGLVGFAIGTETWGSILCPAAFCGITGLRPTYGRVSRAGGMVGSWTFDKIGPRARSAADCRLTPAALAGEAPEAPRA